MAAARAGQYRRRVSIDPPEQPDDDDQPHLAATPGGAGQRLGRRARWQAIQELVTEEPRSIDDLADRIGVSAMTVYRDVAALEQQGVLHRQRGVVTAAPSGLYEASSGYRLALHPESKQALARAAADLVSPGDSVILDDSTTGVHLARRLTRSTPLTVVTNSFAVAREVQDVTDITLLLTGGSYLVWAEALVGPMALDSLRDLRADIVLMSASAVTDDVCYHPDAQMAEVKRAMLAAANRRVLYLDRSKFERTALHAVSPVQAFDTVVLDADAPADRVEHLRSLGVEVLTAPAT